jgi:isoquinoline 1-oxidoreductase/isoquinoline 1-oxidoreductase beta subunit
LHGALIGAGALTLAASCGSTAGSARIRHANETGELFANLYVSVKPDGRIALVVNKAEIGQGVTTGCVTLAAEELSVPIDHVDVQYADSHPQLRTMTGLQMTGASTSTKEAFSLLRQAAAAAREMLVAAAAASWKVPARECRVEDGYVIHGSQKLGYGDLTTLAARESVPAKPRLKRMSEFTLIGKVDRRVEARAKVDGSARYGIDVRLPDMVHAVVVHGPVFGARPDRVSTDAARSKPGVIDIFPFRWGVAVVAEKYWQALAASREIQVTWSKGDAAGLDTAQLQQAMRDYHDPGVSHVDRGDAEQAISNALATVGGTYEAPYLAHAGLEPQNCTVRVTGKRAEVWAPTQSPTIVQHHVAAVIGGDPDDVLVHTTLSGGGFGRRLVPDVCGQAAMISQRVNRLVKLVWSRESDMTQGYYRPVYAVKAAGGVRDGKVTGVQMHCISQSILPAMRDMIAGSIPLPNPPQSKIVESILAAMSTNSVGDLAAAVGLDNSPYRFESFDLTSSPVHTKLPAYSWRSVANSVTGFVMESFIDELAHSAKQDPLALRRQLLPAHSRHSRVLDALERLSKWGTRASPGVGRGLARHFSFDTEVGEVADVEIVDGRIKVRRVYCVVDCGLAVNPDIVRSQMEGGIIFGLSAALDQQITLVDGVVQQRNYDTFPVLRMFEAPEIVVEILPSERDPSGVGEPGLPPIAAAVANAVFALTGHRLRRMPLQHAWNERGAQ